METRLNLTIATKYLIDGLREVGTGLTNTTWKYLGLRGGMHAFTGSTADIVFVEPATLHRRGRQHLAVKR